MMNMTKAKGMGTAVSAPILQRKCACGNHTVAGGECAECRKKRLQRKATNHSEPEVVPPIVHEVLRSPGQPLDSATRAFMEPRFRHDFSQVRVHTNGKAAESAQAVKALAYTVGQNVVFGEGQYALGTMAGQRLLAHELTHTIQQSAATQGVQKKLETNNSHDTTEHEAETASDTIMQGQPFITRSQEVVQIARQQLDAGVPDAGASNLDRNSQLECVKRLGGCPNTRPAGIPTPEEIAGYNELCRRETDYFGLDVSPTDEECQRPISPPSPAPTPTTPCQVCARDLQGVLGLIGNHAYIEAPPFRYAIITPLCPASGTDNPVTGTTAQKWDNSPDPCGKTPKCLSCMPAPGVTDVPACLRTAFTSYNNPSLYRGLGPNSNTFAGTLARTCCAGMVPKPSILGNVPGWDDRPAPARGGASPCPLGPSCT